MIAPSHYYVLLCNILKHLYICYLDSWTIFLSLSIFQFFSHGIHFLIVFWLLVYVICILTISIFIIMYCYHFTDVHCVVWHSFVLVTWRYIGYVIWACVMFRFCPASCSAVSWHVGFVKHIYAYATLYLLKGIKKVICQNYADWSDC